MKKIILAASLICVFSVNAQPKKIDTSISEKSVDHTKLTAVRSYIGPEAYSSNITISGSSTAEQLKEIEQTAKEYGIEIKFTNEKYHRNQLEYIELSYLNNQKWETLTFGSDDLKLLPFDLSFSNKQANGTKTDKLLTVKKNKNNREHPEKETNIQII